MCGIAGVVGIKLDEEVLVRMADAMRHRGPDERGIHQEPTAGLSFRRLAIVDLAGGHQPMANETGTIHVVFNGEIYDHARLRHELESFGHRFVTDHSDTEVLVHGWEQWGTGLFDRLNGMFSVGIWDTEQRRLILARDRYGIKPLYLTDVAGGGLAFASEIRSLHATGLVDCRPSMLGVREYLAFQNVWGDRTMFEGVRQVEPGTFVEWTSSGMRTHRYWDVTFPRSDTATLEEAAERHRDVLSAAVQRQIAADVPVMSYLSGGIDSTAITVAAHRLDHRVTAYSCIFNLDNVGEDRFVDEREYSELVARTAGIDRVVLELSPDSLQHNLERYIRALEEPRMGMGYPIFLVSERVSADARVVLSGTGGDEFHGGYVGRYEALGLTRSPELRSRKWWQRRQLAPDPWIQYQAMLNFLVPAGTEQQVLAPEFLRATSEFDARQVMADVLAECPSTDWFDRVMYVDARTYLHGLLVLEDKLSMSHSLETRVPLLDNELIDMVLDQPIDHLCRGGVGKVLFRESVRPWVAPEIYNKPKMGFGPPDASWYRHELKPWIESRLTPERVASLGVFRPEFVSATLSDHFSGRRNVTYLIWSMLCLDAWFAEYFGR